jgi:hypothetical protein
MVYYNIKKKQASGNTITSTAVGYLDTLNDKNTFEGIHGNPLGEWAEGNLGVDVVDYFDTNDPVYLIDTLGYLIVGLPLITNLENPEA